jgi:hypothetical protein
MAPVKGHSTEQSDCISNVSGFVLLNGLNLKFF